VIGVNARNLKTLDVDRGLFEELAPRIPNGILKVAESGIRGPHDVIAHAAAGKCHPRRELLVTGRDHVRPSPIWWRQGRTRR
jgi:indole-3-glycerol phosphate synthase